MSNPTRTNRTAIVLRRLAAFTYDLFLLFGLWTLTSALVLAITGGRLADPARPDWLEWLFRATLLVVTAVFYIGFWTHGGQTLGMRAWRIKVVDESGGPVRAAQALWRLVGGTASVLAAGLGLWSAAFDPAGRAWLDRVSRTRIVFESKKG